MSDAQSPDPDVLLVERQGPVWRATLNRPTVRNAFDERVIAALRAWAADVARGADAGEARVAVLAGAGPVFSAGADLAWMQRMRDYSRDDNLHDAEDAAALFGALDTLPVPLVGRIQGAALGGGAGLAAVCDVVVAADDAVFGFTEVRLGILPAVIGPFVVAKIGLSAARALFLTGGRFPAPQAHRLGLVHEVVPAAELDAVVEVVVRDLLLGAPSAQRRVKALLRQIVDRPPGEVAPLTSAALADQRVSADGQDGLAAFLHKRRARWAIES
jgi:methylglutaconyl-CoA hydratase